MFILSFFINNTLKFRDSVAEWLRSQILKPVCEGLNVTSVTYALMTLDELLYLSVPQLPYL